MGYVIRKYKIDELPQLWNVLIGDMSLVGPRPEVERYVRLYTPEQKIAALRSFIRVISLPDDKIGIGISKDGKLDKLKEAFKISTRVDEKRLILSRLAANRTVKSLQFAVECAADPELAEAAYAAIADHAHDNVLRQQNMDVFGPAMDLVINKSTNKDLVERVKKYKEQK